jgi:hypothetical protein
VKPHYYPLLLARGAIPFAAVAFLFSVVAEDATSGRSFFALVPAGVMIMARGALMLIYPQAVLAPLAQREETSFWSRSGLRIEHRFGAVLLLVIGAGWAMLGFAQGLESVT